MGRSSPRVGTECAKTRVSEDLVGADNFEGLCMADKSCWLWGGVEGREGKAIAKC